MLRLPGPHADTLGHICAACRESVHSCHVPDRNDGQGRIAHCCCVPCNEPGCDDQTRGHHEPPPF